MATYKLTVGDVADIQLNVTSDSVTTKFSSTGSSEFYVSMLSLTYTKKIFAPSEIHTVLSITAKTSGTTSFPAFSDLHKVFSKKLVTLKDGDTTVAENFFVYKMKPSHGKVSSSSAAMKVELFIFSLDKLLTIDKYCNAFTAKKLGEEIFKGELNKFILEGTTIDGSVNLQFLNYTSQVEKDDKGNEKTVEIRQPYLVQYNESFYDFLARSASRCGEMLYFEGGKLHLGMSANLDTASTDQTTVAESVDYEDSVEEVLQVGDRHYNYFNHTDKDDNRYVDSAFQLLGAFDTEKKINGKKVDNPTTEEKVDKNSDKEVTKITTTKTTYFKNGTETEEVVTEFYTKKDSSPKDQLAGEPKQKVSTLKLTETGKTDPILKVTKTVKYTYVKDDEGNYKKEGKKFVYTTKTDSNVDGDTFPGIYNQPEPNDALFEELEKNGYTSADKEWEWWRTLLFRDIFLNLMDSTTLYDFVADAIEARATSWAHAISDASGKNDENNEKNLTMDSNENPDQVQGNKYNLFSTVGGARKEDKDLTVNKYKSNDVASLLMSAFYTKIREKAREVSEVLVRLDYGANDKGLCLGDVVKVGSGKDDFYIVTKVELNDNGHYIVEAIPSFYKSVSSVTNSDKSVTYTISSFIPCPPLLPDIPPVRISEAQVAFVENNLDPNKLGRVRVRYPWQTANGDCSPWVRMATPFATNGGGVTFKPAEGDEVLLSYEDGNIERPYIVGSLQSKYTTSFWGGLDDRVIQSKNGHAIKFEDKNSGADFFLGWFPLLSIIKSYIPNADWLDFQELNDLTGGISIKDRYGLYAIDMSSDGRAVDIKSPLGNINLSAFTGITISAPNGNIEIKGKNVSISASNKLLLESGSAVSDRWLYEKDKSAMERVDSVATDLLGRTVGKMLDLTFIRTMIEVFTRPVDGTLKIRSNTYLLIEAGQGSAQVPRNELVKPDSGLNSGLTFGSSYDSQIPLLGKLTAAIDALTENAAFICNDIKKAYLEVKKAADEYKGHTIGNVVVYDKISVMKFDGNDNIVDKIFNDRDNANFDVKTLFEEKDFKFDSIDEFKLKVIDENDRSKYQSGKEEPELDADRPDESYAEWADWDLLKRKDENILIPGRKKFVDMAYELGNKLKALFDVTAKWSAFDFDGKQQTDAYYSASLIATVKGKDIFTDFIHKANGGTVNLSADFTNGYEKELLKLKRDLVFELLKEASTAANYKDMFTFDQSKKPNDLSDDSSWKDFALTVEAPSETLGIGGTLKKSVKNYFKKEGNKWKETLSCFTNPFDNKQKWTAPEKGRILLSDMPGRTIHFDADQLVTDHNSGEVTTAHPMALQRKVNSVK